MGIVLSAIAMFLVAAAAGVALRRLSHAPLLVYGVTGAVCSLLVLWAVLRLAGGAGVEQAVLPLGLPWMAAHLRVDALSAVFLLVVNLAGATACLFGWGYDRAHAAHGHGGDQGPVLPVFPLFLAGMNLVPVADDAFVFLVSWEFMSLASWLLVLATHREEETPRAARLYLIMASFGTVCLLLVFGLLAGAHGDYSFDAIRAQPPAPWAAGLAVVLVMVGAGSKAGLVPLHVWLPLAHPAAPSHVSALMSGVMTKIAVYAMIRVLFDLVGEPAWWWGGLLLAAGALTAVMGVLYALMQDDLKRLLAYSTVENIGAIVIALGLALVFKAGHTPVIAALALSAALLHVINHSLFKSLLFYGAGAVLSATGTRDLNRLGGLIHAMPTTAFLVLVGCTAIAALPPLNGFVGEWLLFQAILNAPALPEWELKIGIAVVGAALALSTALAGACFVRLFGTAFLGRPRSPEAAGAHDVGSAMRLGMTVPAVLCVLIGVLPTPLLRLFEPAIRLMVEAGPFDDRAYQPWFWLAPTSAIGNSYNGLVMLVVIAGLGIVLVAGIHRWASARVRRSIPWGCGFTDPDPAALSQYSASSFAQPIRRAFGTTVFAARDLVEMPEPGDTRPARLTVSWRDPAWEWVFVPVVRSVERLADWLNGLQFLTIRRYLMLMFFALVTLLAIVAVVQR
ncbi:hydrogenase 4 subunit B [Azospirillum oleiclasticum]|uniref:hydrogenase 4 subunit B n=1 Tax=Azospirillum oleiclasticum TaxID=2735135 RepID=UPI001FE301E3|nr:hydrogenase 4 subunit B [Azospirillum oleiclasticum]